MSGRIGVLDGLRGVAIAGVLILHLLYVPVWTQPERFATRLWGLTLSPQTILTNAGIGGVTLFFLLSGFVLALPYVRGERTMRTLGDARRFWGRRAARLLPLFFAGAIASLLLFGRADPHQAVLLLTGLFAWLPSTVMPAANPVLWSIGAEWWLSLAFPALLAAQARYGSTRTLGAAAGAASYRWIEFPRARGSLRPGDLAVVRDDAARDHAEEIEPVAAGVPGSRHPSPRRPGHAPSLAPREGDLGVEAVAQRGARLHLREDHDVVVRIVRDQIDLVLSQAHVAP